MTLGTSPSTQALLDLEDASPAVLAESLPGSEVPFWPQVRSAFMFAITEQYFGNTSVATPTSRAAAWRKLVSAFVPSTKDPRRLRGPIPLVYMVSGTTTYRAGSRTRDWLVGDFVEAQPDESVILQWAELPATRTAFEPTRSLSGIASRAAGYARLTRGGSETLGSVDRLVREYARLLGLPIDEGRIGAITATAAYHQGLAPHFERSLLKVLDRLQPDTVIMQGAAYGQYSALIFALKRRGVRVVEPQHGWIGPSHGAYNFGAAMHSPELAATLPDELLTFGDYWSSGLRTPFVTTAIGKPHLEAMQKGADQWEERPREVLFVSSVADPERSTDFGLALAEALPSGWQVRFRPHPRERPVVANRYARMLTHSRITLDEEPDVYVSLRTARGVVGVASTVLFEALALGCRVFALDGPFAPYFVGDLFGPLIDGPDSASFIIDELNQPGPTVSRARLDTIWKPHAIQNFGRWSEDRLGT